MSEAPNRNDNFRGQEATQRRVVGVALLVGIVIPVLGYGTLLSSHGIQGPPRWVYGAIPAALAGPDIPSLAQFVVLAIVNMVLWFSISYWIAKGLAWSLRR